MKVYPLIFAPIYKPRVWGGRKLESLLGKTLPPDMMIGESWELCDLEDDQSVVANGPARGKTLCEIVREWGGALLGGASLVDGRFPLLLKFLDAREALSIQVHPDGAAARAAGGRVRVKHEAWYVVDADENAMIYRGLKPGTDAAAVRAAIERNALPPMLQRIPARKGHCHYIPSGTVHALGAGAVVAEIQTPWDITYRLYDWDRIDPATGTPRELHVQQALGSLSYEPVLLQAERRQHTASVWTSVTSLIRCEAFVIERVRMIQGVEQIIPYDEMVIWMVLEGEGQIVCEGLSEPFGFRKGDTILLPAAMKQGRVRTSNNCMWLEVSVPVKSTLAEFERPSAAVLTTPEPATPFVPLNLPRRDQPPRASR